MTRRRLGNGFVCTGFLVLCSAFTPPEAVAQEFDVASVKANKSGVFNERAVGHPPARLLSNLFERPQRDWTVSSNPHRTPPAQATTYHSRRLGRTLWFRLAPSSAM
jgi:hypothetical protein